MIKKKRIEFSSKTSDTALSYSDLGDSLSELIKSIFIENKYSYIEDNSFESDWCIKLKKEQKEFILVIVVIEQDVNLFKCMILFEDYNNKVLYDEEVFKTSFEIISLALSEIEEIENIKIVEVSQ